MTQRERDALAARVREDEAWAASAERAAEEAEYVRVVVCHNPDHAPTAAFYMHNDTVPPRTFANVRAAGQAWRWVAFFVLWFVAMFAVLAGAYVMSRGA